nr:hypothetical protein [Tanacetum cinerariifolium]
MALTFTDTHYMIAFLTKSDVSEGFEKLIDFLNAHVIKYALMVNLTIYVSYIKQFWTSVSIKKSNDVVRLQALIDRKKVIIIEDSIRQALRLDDVDSVDYLPNKEIFAELARMGYEKPSIRHFSRLNGTQDVEDAALDEDDVNEVFDEPTPPSSTPATPPPPPQPEHIPSPPQTATAQSSPLPQQQPSHTAKILMTIFNQLLKTCATLTKQVANLEQDKGRLEESRAKVYHMDVEHNDEVLSMQETDEAEPAEVEEVIEVVTAAKLMTKVVTIAATTPITVALVHKASALRRRRGVIIQDPEEADTASVIVHSKDEAFSRESEAELNANINWNDVVDQARKNMMVYLKNMAGFKMDFFRGMTYTEIRPIFEKHYNLNQAFLERLEEEVIGQEEEVSKRKSKSSKQRTVKKQKINEEVEELKTHLQIVPNDEHDVYTEATPLALKVPVVDY